MVVGVVTHMLEDLPCFYGLAALALRVWAAEHQNSVFILLLVARVQADHVLISNTLVCIELIGPKQAFAKWALECAGIRLYITVTRCRKGLNIS